MTTDQYKIIKKDDQVIVILFKDLPQDIESEFTEKIKNYVYNPINVVINCFLIDSIPEQWLQIFYVAHQLLMAQHKKLTFLFTSEKVRSKINEMQIKSFLLFPSYNKILKVLKIEGPAINYNFIKSFVTSTIKTLFVQADTICSRKSIFLKTDNSKEFCGDVSGSLNIITSNYFYTVSISFPESTYLQAMSTMLEEEMTEILDENIDGAAEIMNIIIGQTMALNDSHDKSMTTTIPKPFAGKEYPKKTFEFNGKEYNLFEGGKTIVIPFISSKGDFFIEIWLDKHFEKVLASIVGN